MPKALVQIITRALLFLKASCGLNQPILYLGRVRRDNIDYDIHPLDKQTDESRDEFKVNHVAQKIAEYVAEGNTMLMNSNEYLHIVESIKQEIRTAQYRATVSVNRELLVLYHSIGEVINEHKTWGNKFVENLAADIKISFPDATGYSTLRDQPFLAACSAYQICSSAVFTLSIRAMW